MQKNRQTLNIDAITLHQVTSQLAESSQRRRDFMSNPELFLKENKILLRNANLSTSSNKKTSEVCTLVFVCGAVVVVEGAVGFVLVAAAAVAAVYSAAVVTEVAVGGGGNYLSLQGGGIVNPPYIR